jgi:hypothetical protein
VGRARRRRGAARQLELGRGRGRHRRAAALPVSARTAVRARGTDSPLSAAPSAEKPPAQRTAPASPVALHITAISVGAPISIFLPRDFRGTLESLGPLDLSPALDEELAVFEELDENRRGWIGAFEDEDGAGDAPGKEASSLHLSTAYGQISISYLDEDVPPSADDPSAPVQAQAQAQAEPAPPPFPFPSLPAPPSLPSRSSTRPSSPTSPQPADPTAGPALVRAHEVDPDIDACPKGLVSWMCRSLERRLTRYGGFTDDPLIEIKLGERVIHRTPSLPHPMPAFDEEVD